MNIDIDPQQAEALKAAAEAEAQKQQSTVGDVAQGATELVGDVVLTSAGDVVASAVGATIEGAGAVLSVVGEAAGAIITGALDGL